MAAVTVQTITDDGVVPSYAAVNSSDTIKVSDEERHFLHVKNGGGGSINVTITAQKTTARVPGVGALTIPNLVVAVANGAEKMIGPFTSAYIGDDGNVDVAYSGTTSVTAAAFKLPAQ